MDAPALFDVHQLLVVELSFGSGPQLPQRSRVGADELFQVVTGAEVLAVGGEDDDPHGVVALGDVEGLVERIYESHVLSVCGIRPVQGDRGDGAVHPVEHDRLRASSAGVARRLICRHRIAPFGRWLPRQQARAANRAPARR